MSAETPQTGTDSAFTPDETATDCSNNAGGYVRGLPAPSKYPAPVTLREIRIRANLSQSEVAHRAGLRPAIVSQIETGRLVATTDEAAAIARALDLDAGSLVPRTLLILQEPAA